MTTGAVRTTAGRWGALIWLAMTTGARRGELCALRWSRLDLTPDRAVMWLRRAISKGVDGWTEGDLKTHQQRRVALDPETVEDVRTVVGRLGHSGGGTTTLRTYVAWVSEADQRAASGIGTRMPSRPAPLAAAERAQRDPQSPYEKIAAELRSSILSGALADGDFAPTEKQLAAEHQVSIGTAHRAMELLKTWGFITSSRGRRAIVVCPSSEPLLQQARFKGHLNELRGAPCPPPN